MTKTEHRCKLCVYLGAPFAFVAVILAGFVLLSIQNLDGTVAARQLISDHGVVIHNLFIRD